MRKLLKRLFTGKRLIDYAHESEVDIFVDHFLGTTFYLAGLEEQEGLQTDFDEVELLAYIESYMNFDPDDFSPMFASHDSHALAIFTTMENRELFTGSYSKQRDRVFAFQTIDLSGEALSALFESVEGVVVNPGSNEEFRLTEEQMNALRAASARLA
ncbi:MAG: SseB family protein [Verrucomicrobiota bacterium]